MADTLIDNVVCFSHTNDTDTLYGVVRAVTGADAGKIRDIVNSQWDVHPGSGSLDDYDISAAVPVGGLWLGGFPNLDACPAGFYVYQMRLRAGATPDCSDSIIGAEKGYWNGSVFAASANLDDGGRVRLASDGLNSVSTAEPSGAPANFREYMVWLVRRFFNKHKIDSASLAVYKDNSTDIMTTQIVIGDETEQTVFKAS